MLQPRTKHVTTMVTRAHFSNLLIKEILFLSLSFLSVALKVYKFTKPLVCAKRNLDEGEGKRTVKVLFKIQIRL